ncbi:Hypothetical predicted protein, partial [Marmota monax]
YEKAFNVGCPRNCYIALCAPLGPKYMSEAVCIQVDQGTNWGPTEHLKDLLWPRSATQVPQGVASLHLYRRPVLQHLT